MNESRGGPLVLIVDDEPAVRELERRILASDGYRVLEAASGAEAFQVLASGVAPDLLIADLDMPGVSGEEMVRRVHEARPNQKVLYVTANIDRLLDVRSITWEGEAFLDKPFTAKGLLEAVSLLRTGTLGRRSPKAASKSRGASRLRTSISGLFRAWSTK